MKELLLLLALVIFPAITFSQQPLLGNPSNATPEESNANNFLMVKTGYILSYNRERGGPNWVNWHISRADLSGADRSDSFAPDMQLPESWRIKPTDYLSSGYDRGHICPSADRLSSVAANVETFLMSNMSPQRPNLNRNTWGDLEDSLRRIVQRGNEAYVYAGCYGNMGRIKDKITIPTNCFKIALILPEAGNDLSRIKSTTRVISVDMPNRDDIDRRWRQYLTTTDAIETATGYDFFSVLSEDIQAAIESRKDN